MEGRMMAKRTVHAFQYSGRIINWNKWLPSNLNWEYYYNKSIHSYILYSRCSSTDDIIAFHSALSFIYILSVSVEPVLLVASAPDDFSWTCKCQADRLRCWPFRTWQLSHLSFEYFDWISTKFSQDMIFPWNCGNIPLQAKPLCIPDKWMLPTRSDRMCWRLNIYKIMSIKFVL